MIGGVLVIKVHNLFLFIVVCRSHARQHPVSSIQIDPLQEMRTPQAVVSRREQLATSCHIIMVHTCSSAE